MQGSNAQTSLSPIQRQASLDIILQHSPFSTLQLLFAEFDAIESTGTRLVLWDLKRELLEFERYDIVMVRAPTPNWPHERSLRGFLEVLYYADQNTEPSLAKILVQGCPVEFRDWTSDLHHAGHYHYRPRNAEKDAAVISFGFRRPLKDIVRVFSSNPAKKSEEMEEKIWYNKNSLWFAISTPT